VFYLVPMVSTTTLLITLALSVIQIARHVVGQAVLSAYHALLNSTKHQPTNALILVAKVNIQSLEQILPVRIAITPVKHVQALQALNAFLALGACTSTHGLTCV